MPTAQRVLGQDDVSGNPFIINPPMAKDETPKQCVAARATRRPHESMRALSASSVSAPQLPVLAMDTALASLGAFCPFNPPTIVEATATSARQV